MSDTTENINNENNENNEKTKLWLWLTTKPHLMRKAYRLYTDMGSIEAIYNAERTDYEKFKYLNTENINNLCDKTIKCNDIINACVHNSVRILTIDDNDYPVLLREIDEPPVLLYCRGKFIDLNKYLCIGIVGTRDVSNYGSKCTYFIAKEAADYGAIIVSGMALGVDTVAHTGALEADMPTVAVLGCGVNNAYPKSNLHLMHQIMETGMVISEYPLNSEPERYHFPERNRIISGLSRGVAVIEADIKSGSLITAKCAYNQNRDVFAVPGNINQIHSKGTNQLIRDGAYLITSGDDIISHYRSNYPDEILTGLKTAQAIRAEKKRKIDTMAYIDENIDYRLYPPVKERQNQNLNNITSISDASAASRFKTPDRGTIKITKTEDLPPDERILAYLSDTPMHINKLCELCKLKISDINSAVLCLEIAGKITKHPGNYYTKNTK